MNKTTLFRTSLLALDPGLDDTKFCQLENQVVVALSELGGKSLAMMPFKINETQEHPQWAFPLTLAIEGGSVRCVEELLNKGACPSVKFVPGPKTRSSNMEEWACAILACWEEYPDNWMTKEQRFLSIGKILLDHIPHTPLNDWNDWQKNCVLTLSKLPTHSAEKFLLLLTQHGVLLDQLSVWDVAPQKGGCGIVVWEALKRRVGARTQANILTQELNSSDKLDVQKKKM